VKVKTEVANVAVVARPSVSNNRTTVPSASSAGLTVSRMTLGASID
jgi:hypothetical protein